MANKPECIFRWDTTPMKAYRISMPIEEAVFDLVNYHNEKIVDQRDLLENWINTEQESYRNNRAIVRGDILQVRVIGNFEERNYFLGCCFELSRERAELRMYSQNPSLALILKGIPDKQKELGKEIPETVGDYALLKEETDPVLLQIACFGSKRRGKTARFE